MRRCLVAGNAPESGTVAGAFGVFFDAGVPDMLGYLLPVL